MRLDSSQLISMCSPAWRVKAVVSVIDHESHNFHMGLLPGMFHLTQASADAMPAHLVICLLYLGVRFCLHICMKCSGMQAR